MFNTEPPKFYKIHLLVDENGMYKREYDDNSVSLGLNEEQAINMWAAKHKLDRSEIQRSECGGWYLNDNKIFIVELNLENEKTTTINREIWS